MMRNIRGLFIGLLLLNPFVLGAQERDCNDYISLFEAGEYKEVITVLLDCKKNKGINEETKKKVDFYLYLSYGLLEDFASIDAAALEGLIRDDVVKYVQNVILAYIVLSNFHTHNRNYDKSVELNEELLFLAKQYVSIESHDYAILSNRLATSYSNAGNYSNAIEFGRQTSNIIKQVLGENHPDYATSLDNLAHYYSDFGDYPKAVELEQQALKIRKQVLGENHPDYGTSLNNLALYNSYLGNYSKAIEFGQRGANIYRQFFGETHPDYATSLDNLAGYYSSLGDYSKAIEIAEQVLTIRKQVLGEEHPDYAISLSSLGMYYSSLDDYSKAIEFGQQALDIQKQLFGENHPDYAASLNYLANYYSDLGDYSKAIELGQHALKIRKQVLGEDNSAYAMSLNNLAFYYSSLGDYGKAIEMGQEALIVRKRVLGENHPMYATSLNNLAGYYSYLGDCAKAIELGHQALNIYKQIFGENHLNYAKSLNNLSNYYSDLGDYTKSIEFARQALNIRKQVLGENHSDYALSLLNLGNCYFGLGDYSKAIELCQQGANIYRQVFGENHPEYATSLNNLAITYSKLGNYSKAIELVGQVLEIRKEVLGDEHPDYATSIGNLAGYYFSLGDYSKAIELGQRALNIFRQVLGENHPAYAAPLSDLSRFYSSLGNYTKAIDMAQQALSVYKQVFGDNHPGYAATLNNLALYYFLLGDYSKAIEISEQALFIRKEMFGEEHPDYATSLSDLGLYYSSVEDYSKAIELGRQALRILKQVFGEDHPMYGISLENSAFYYFYANDFLQTAEYLEKPLQIRKDRLQYQFTWLTERERDLYWNQEKALFMQLPSFGYSSDSSSLFVNTVYDGVLLSKGLMLNASMELNSILAESGNAEVITKAAQLRTTYHILNRLYEKPVSERYLNTDSLETEAQQLERELLSMSKEYGDYTRFMSVTWQDVQNKLNDNDVAIEFVEFPVIKSDSVMYAAMVLRKGWDRSRMIPLFEKNEIERFLQQSPDKQYSGFVGKQLRSLMWDPLESVISPGENVYFSAAGVYHQLALEYLPSEDGTPLCDIYQLHRLSSTRQLVLEKDMEPYKDAVLYGGIQYDVNPEEMLSASRKYQPGESLYAYRGASADSLRGSRWVALANTVPEVNFISEELKRNHVHTHTYTGSSANEESLKALSGKKVNILHLATHGFFLPVEETRKINYFQLMGQEGNSMPDFSMRRSGLIMAGGNGIWTGNAIPEGMDDGILTAQEISVLDFRGMDMVVLSACETALGDINTSEGVFGLQRAFKKAGVNTLVMSLWKVNDEITKVLMNKFYQTLLEGKSKREAFQEAQRFIRTSHPQPRDWAAFIMLD